MIRRLFLIAGALNLLLGLFHLFFWKLFNWPQDLMSISHDNRAILQIANIHLTMLIVFFGYISIVHWKDLFANKIGKAVSLFMAAFYFIRVINEAVFWDIQSWESLVTALICCYFIVVYALPIFKNSLPKPAD